MFSYFVLQYLDLRNHESTFCLCRKEFRSSEWVREFDMLREHCYCEKDVVTDRGTQQGEEAEDRSFGSRIDGVCEAVRRYKWLGIR